MGREVKRKSKMEKYNVGDVKGVKTIFELGKIIFFIYQLLFFIRLQYFFFLIRKDEKN